MPCPPTHPRPARGFTLLELILVLVILAIVSGMLVPSLSSFAAGRARQNAATTVLGLANYARSQAVSEGVPYRLNFDAGAGTVWVTYQKEGTFQTPANDYGQRFNMPDGVRLAVQVTPGTVSVPSRVQSPDVQQQQSADAAPPFGAAVSTPNTLVSLPHADGGTYVEVQPGGRTDPCLIQLTDRQGTTVSIGCATATDVMHVLKPGEM